MYRDMEDRTLRKVARQLNKSLTQIAKWSEPHNWVERVAAYDDYQREQDRLQYEADKRKAKAERHRMIRAAKGKAALKLDRLNVDDMSPAEFIRFLQMVLTEERNEFDDLPTSKTDITTGGEPIRAFTEIVVEKSSDE